jgi:hypothetical protein
MEEGFEGLLRDKTRPWRIKPLGAEAAEGVVALTLGEPPGETTHWTGALMAKASGLSLSSVQRIWRAHSLQPHRVRHFKLSKDPRFIDKLRDVVGLYVDPPAHAVVLSVDEKSQIQALDRTQAGLCHSVMRRRDFGRLPAARNRARRPRLALPYPSLKVGWNDVGSADDRHDPFAPIAGSILQHGCHSKRCRRLHDKSRVAIKQSHSLNDAIFLN